MDKDKLKLELNRPVQAELLYSKAQSGTNAYGDWFRYSLVSGDSLFIAGKDCDDPDEMFATAGVGPRQPFVICLRKTKQGARYFQVQALSDAAEEPAGLDPARYPDTAGAFASKLEARLAASITHEQQRKAAVTPSKSSPSSAVVTSSAAAPVCKAQPQQTNPIAIVPAPSQQGTTRASSMMASALIAAFDASCLATQYAASKGLALQFSSEDIRTMANSMLMNIKDAAMYQRQGGR
jgi:hypothetical protein